MQKKLNRIWFDAVQPAHYILEWNDNTGDCYCNEYYKRLPGPKSIWEEMQTMVDSQAIVGQQMIEWLQQYGGYANDHHMPEIKA